MKQAAAAGRQLLRGGHPHAPWRASSPVHFLSPCPPLARQMGEKLDWIAPMMPVIYPEDCTPGAWQLEHPACNRSQLWLTEAPPPAVADIATRQTQPSFCIQAGALGDGQRAGCGQRGLHLRGGQAASRALQQCTAAAL